MLKKSVFFVTVAALSLSLAGCGWFGGRSSDDGIAAGTSDLNVITPTTLPVTQPVLQPVAPTPVSPVAFNPGNALARVDNVSVNRNPNAPDQLIVEINGHLPNGCSEIGLVDYKVFGTTYRYTLPLADVSRGQFCTQALVPFQRRFAINPGGQPLAPGTYQVDANGYIQPFNI